MEVRVLGSYGARLPECRSSSLLIDRTLLLDAGTVTATLSLEEQAAVDDVLLTHAHLDHIVDLAFMVDNVLTLRTEPLRVWAPQPVLETLQSHLFNDVVWPDFTRLPDPAAPTIVLRPLPKGREIEIAGLRVAWERVAHPVYAAGYRIAGADAAFLFSGDTGPTEALWRLGRDCPELTAVFVETTFPNRLEGIAAASGHLTPAMLPAELDKLGRRDVPVRIFHMKPQFLDEITAELAALGDGRLQTLRGGETFLL